jgi:hypothetical protein
LIFKQDLHENRKYQTFKLNLGESGIICQLKEERYFLGIVVIVVKAREKLLGMKKILGRIILPKNHFATNLCFGIASSLLRPS